MFAQQEPPTAAAAPAIDAEAAPEGRPGQPVDLGRVLRSVRTGWRWIFLSTIAMLVVGATLARKFVAREYTSDLSILWEPGSADGSAAEDEGRTLRTLSDTVKLPVNLARVRERLHLTLTLERLGRRVEVTSSSETRLILLSAIGESPDEARALAQTVSDVFLEHRRTLERTRLEERVRVYETDEREARTALEAGRQRYDSFRRLHRIANLPAEQLAAIEHAARLRADADLARAEAEGEHARELSLRSAARTQSALTVLSESEQMLGAQRLADSEGALAQASARLTDAHPTLRALRAETQALRAGASTAVRTGRIVGRNPHWDEYTASATTASAVGSSLRRREELLRSSLRETAARVDELASLDGESATLLASVTVAERHLAEVLALRARAEDARRSPATGLRVVAAAVAPDRPSKSMRRPVIVLSAVLGALLSTVTLLIRGLRGGRAFSPGEVAFWLNAPVLASSEWPSTDEALAPLIDDVSEHLTRSPGTTLVLALNKSALSCAIALVDELALQSETSGRSETGQPIEAREPKANKTRVELRLGGASQTLVVSDCASQGALVRRLARTADRVLIVVESGAQTAMDLLAMRKRLGTLQAVAAVVVNVDGAAMDGADRVGSAQRFERGERVARTDQRTTHEGVQTP